jgi:4-diphosphocytidyl-2-C-methyl-D-erythritol kinase
MAVLLRIGADVPMCVQAQPALVRGIGEQITPLPNMPPLHAVLVNPRVQVPTPAVFAALACKENAGFPPLPSAMQDTDTLLEWLAQQRNDLQAPAIAAAPVIADVLAAIAQTGASLVRMSGSGATCFGLYEDAVLAQTASAALRKVQPQWWIAPCCLNSAIDVQATPLMD